MTFQPSGQQHLQPYTSPPPPPPVQTQAPSQAIQPYEPQPYSPPQHTQHYAPLPPVQGQGFAPPRAYFETNRSSGVIFLLGIVTFGIYFLVAFTRAGEDLNAMLSRWDGKNTMNYVLVALVLSPVTFGIFSYVWWHQTSERMSIAQRARGMQPAVTASDFWLWGVLGSFIFMNKWVTALNQLSADVNARG